MKVRDVQLALLRYQPDAEVRIHLSDVDARTGVDLMAECEPMEIVEIREDPDSHGPLLVTENV
jgi:hypothetical protein